MTVIDPTTSLGKVRLRTGDWQDIVILPDAVINSALSDCDGSVARASQLCAQYILATLSSNTHRKIPQFETWGNEYFEQYLKFIKATINNPNFMDISPLPYGGGTSETHPIMAFMEQWNEDNGCL
jgi:hypothetical protein